MNGPYEHPSPAQAEVVRPRFRRLAAGAVAAAVIVIAGIVAVFALGDGDDAGDVVAPPDEPPPTSSSTTSTFPPPTTLGDVVVPSVVGDDRSSAVDRLEDEGFTVVEEFRVTTPDDPDVGSITGQGLDPGDVVPRGAEIVIEVALLPDQWANARDRCARTPYLSADLDGDGRPEGVHPRRVDGVVNEIEVCTADGTPVLTGGLALAGVEAVVDLDLDGLAEIVAPVDAEGRRTQLLSLLDGEVVAVGAPLSHGESVDAATTAWWGCMAFPGSTAERLAVGGWSPTADGGVQWQVTETWIQEGAFATGRTLSGSWDADTVADRGGVATPPGRARCVPSPNTGSPCLVPGSLIGDIDGDGRFLDAIAVRDGFVCLTDGATAAVDEITADATTWFLGDVEGDGRLEVFLGTTTAYSTTLRPYTVTDDAELVPLGDRAYEQWVPDWAVLPGVEPRWFACVAPSGDEPGRTVAGSFWIDPEAGTVRWTVDGETEGEAAGDADPEPQPIVHEAVFDDPTATDAWMPGNACNRSAWTGGRIEFDDEGQAIGEALEELNDWLTLNDPEGVRRFLIAREALGIAGSLREAGGPYREDPATGVIELHGLHDDSTGALRWEVSLSEDRGVIVGIARSWRCARGSDTTSWTTEPCP